MKKIIKITVLLISCSINLLASSNKPNIVTDTILILQIEKMQDELDVLKENHKQFEYQKNYFSQALDSQKDFVNTTLNAQNTIYSYNTAWFIAIITTVVTIVFGLIAFITYWKITSDFKKHKDDLSQNIETLDIEHKNLKLDSFQAKADLYVTHMNLKSKKIDKIKYSLLAIKFYLLALKHEEALTNCNYLKTKILKEIPDNEKFEIQNEYTNSLNLINELFPLNKFDSNESELAINGILNEIVSSYNRFNPNL